MVKADRKRRITCAFLSAFLLIESIQPARPARADELTISDPVVTPDTLNESETLIDTGDGLAPPDDATLGDDGEIVVPAGDEGAEPSSPSDGDVTPETPSIQEKPAPAEATDADDTAVRLAEVLSALVQPGDEEGLSALERAQIQAMPERTTQLLRATRTLDVTARLSETSTHVLRLLPDEAFVIDDLTFYRRDVAAQQAAVEREVLGEEPDATAPLTGLFTGRDVPAGDIAIDTTALNAVHQRLQREIDEINAAKTTVAAAERAAREAGTEPIIDPAIAAKAALVADDIEPVPTYITLTYLSDPAIVLPLTVYPTLESREAVEANPLALTTTGVVDAAATAPTSFFSRIRSALFAAPETTAPRLTWTVTFTIDSLQDVEQAELAFEAWGQTNLHVQTFTRSDGRTSEDLIALAKAQAAPDAPAPYSEDLTTQPFVLTDELQAGYTYTLTLTADADAAATTADLSTTLSLQHTSGTVSPVSTTVLRDQATAALSLSNTDETTSGTSESASDTSASDTSGSESDTDLDRTSQPNSDATGSDASSADGTAVGPEDAPQDSLEDLASMMLAMIALPGDLNPQSSPEAPADDVALTFVNERNAGFRLQKVDEGDAAKKLAGAVFTLTPEGGSDADVITVTTDGLGVAAFEGLSAGTYTLREVEAPDGYASTGKTATIVVDETGGIAWSGDLVNTEFSNGTSTVTTKEYVAPIAAKGSYTYASDAYPYYMNAFSYVEVPDPSSHMVEFYLMLKPDRNDLANGSFVGQTDRDTRLNIYGENLTIQDVALYDVDGNSKETARNLVIAFRADEWNTGEITSQTEMIQNYPFTFRQNVSDFAISGGTLDVNAEKIVPYQVGMPKERFGYPSVDLSYLVKVKAEVQNVDAPSSISYDWFTGIDSKDVQTAEQLYQTHTFDVQPLREDVWQTVTVNPKDPLLTVTNAAQNLGRLVLKKVEALEGETLSPLAGAEFTLTPQGGTNGVVAVSDRNGRAAFLNLEQGTYTLQETKAPSGYDASSDTWTVTVGAQGVVSVQVVQQGGASISADPQSPTEENPLVVLNTKKEVTEYRGKVHLNKVNEKNEPLAGVTFQLLNWDGTPVTFTNPDGTAAAEQTYTTDANGDITITDVPAGNYLLHETATQPGYELLQQDIPVSVGQVFDIPENATPRDLSEDVGLELLGYGTNEGASVNTLYPNQAGSIYVENRYTFPQGIKGGDYFYLDIDDNWDLRGLSKHTVGGFDLIGPAGVVATGVYELEQNRVKYTFTQYVDLYDVREAKARMTAFINKYAVKYNAYDWFAESIGQATDASGQLVDEEAIKFYVDYAPAYTEERPSIGSAITALNEEEGTFREVIYLNPEFDFLRTMELWIRPYEQELGDSSAYFTTQDMQNIRVYPVREYYNNTDLFYPSYGWTDAELAQLGLMTNYTSSMPDTNGRGDATDDTSIRLNFGNYFNRYDSDGYYYYGYGAIVVVDGHFHTGQDVLETQNLRTSLLFQHRAESVYDEQYWSKRWDSVQMYSNAGEATGDPNTVEVTAKNVPAPLTFYKVGEIVDENGNVTGTLPLAGASFALYKKNEAGEYVDTGSLFKSDGEGKIVLKGLSDGEYKLVETQVPQGYDAAQKAEKAFKVTGETVEVLNAAGTYESLTAGGDGQERNDQLVNKRNPLGSFTLRKVDIEGNPMAGVTFRLRNSQGWIERWNGDDPETSSEGVELTTDENGYITFSNLPFGKYFLREIATQDGYVLDSTPRPVLIGEKWDAPATTGIDLSDYLLMKSRETSPDPSGDSTVDVTTTATVVPIKDIVIDETQKGEYYPNSGQVLMTKIDYVFKTEEMAAAGVTLRSGDTFTVNISDNLDLRVLSPGPNEAFDLYNEQGRLAVANISDDLKTITYTFTMLVDNYAVNEFTLNLPMGIDRSAFTNDVQGAKLEVNIGERQEIADDQPKNDYHFTKNVYFTPYGGNTVESLMTRFDTATGNFETVIYVNANHESLYLRSLLFRSPQAMTIDPQSIEVYATIETLPISFGISFETGTDAAGSDLKLQRLTNVNPYAVPKEPNTWMIPLEQVDNLSYVVRLKGRALDTYQPFKTTTNLYYSAIDAAVEEGERIQVASWDTENKFYNPYASFTSSGAVPEFRNVVNKITFTKLAAPTLDAEGHLSNERKKLQGGLFELYKVSTDNDGRFYYALYTELGTGENGYQQKADENGVFGWEKLPPGEYHVMESQAPLGYKHPADSWVSSFTVDDQGNIVNIQNHTTDILNEPVFYPMTGGLGGFFFTFGGLALMALAYLELRRKGVREG